MSLLIGLMIVTNSWASTFVGNGGNAGDVEWNVSLKQISMAVDAFQDHTRARSMPDEKICTCSQTYSNSSVCDALKALNDEQRLFCGSTLKKQIPQLAPLVRDNRTVRVSWTADDIDVLDNGQRRVVDAVTDRSKGTVTLNAEHFRSLNPSERVFLISHELMHLTTLEEKPLTDEGAQGPFTGVGGSRALVNAMAAALVIQAEDMGAFDRYRRTLNRPQGWKQNWISISGGAGSQSAGSIFNVNDYRGFSLRYTRFFSNLGAQVEFSEREGERTPISQVTAKETLSILRAGVSYRVFPFKDPLKVFGQSHLVFNANVDFVKGTYNLKSTMNDETATSNRVGASGGIRYEFPVIAGIWVSLAETYESLAGPYTVAGVKIENEKNIFATSIGASYAF